VFGADQREGDQQRRQTDSEAESVSEKCPDPVAADVRRRKSA